MMQSIFCSKEKCEKCARCCRSFLDIGITPEEDRKIRESIYSNSGIIYTHRIMMRLCVSPDEANIMRDEAEKRKIPLNIIPNKVVYDAESDKVVIIDFIIDMGQCPFVSSENLCTIYEKRPRVCRQFPQIESNTEEVKQKIREMGISPKALDYDSALKRVQALLQI